jgi:hypothetical protein
VDIFFSCLALLPNVPDRASTSVQIPSASLPPASSVRVPTASFPPSTSPPPKAPKPKGFPHIIIAGTVAGGVGFSVLMFVIAIFLIHRRRLVLSRSSQTKLTPFEFPSSQEIFDDKEGPNHTAQDLLLENLEQENLGTQSQEMNIESGYPEQEASTVRMLARQELNERFRELHTRGVQDAVVEVVASVMARLDLASDGVPPTYASNQNHEVEG